MELQEEQYHELLDIFLNENPPSLMSNRTAPLIYPPSFELLIQIQEKWGSQRERERR